MKLTRIVDQLDAVLGGGNHVARLVQHHFGRFGQVVQILTRLVRLDFGRENELSTGTGDRLRGCHELLKFTRSADDFVRSLTVVVWKSIKTTNKSNDLRKKLTPKSWHPLPRSWLPR